MGYSHKFYKFKTSEIQEIQNCKTANDFVKWIKEHYPDAYEEDDDYVFLPNIDETIHDFGKYVEWAFDIQKNNKSIFTADELKEKYEDFCPVICSKDNFLTAIEDYRKKTYEYYSWLLKQDQTKKDQFLQRQMEEWDGNITNCIAINTDPKREYITNSWDREYNAFELVRMYKTFDWKNNTLVLMGH